MSDEFHATRMGSTYYEKTLPDLVRQVARLNEFLERIAAALEAKPPTKGKDA